MNTTINKPSSGFSRTTVLATILCIALLGILWYSYQNWFKNTLTADERKLQEYRLEVVSKLSQVPVNTPVNIDLVVRRQDGSVHSEWDEVRGDNEYMRLVVAYSDLQTVQIYYPTFDPATGVFRVELSLPRPGSVVLFADVVPDTGVFSAAPTVHPSLGLMVSGIVAPSINLTPNANPQNNDYTVKVDPAGSVVQGEPVLFRLSVQKGEEVVEVDKKEGVYGRIAIIRQGSMEYSSAIFTDEPLELSHTFINPGVYALVLETQVGDSTVQSTHMVSVSAKAGQ